MRRMASKVYYPRGVCSRQIIIETDGDTRQEIIEMFEQMGYRVYMLENGREVALDKESDKDIIFRY